MSSLILSEAVFVPLMLAALWGLAVLWVGPGQTNGVDGLEGGLLVALGSGGAAGVAILVRPSWALFVPVVLLFWLIATAQRSTRPGRGGARGVALRSGSHGGDEPLVGSQCADLRPVCADGALDGGQPL